MLLRPALLLCFISLSGSSKLHEIVKNVGKRFEDNMNLLGYADPGPRSTFKIDPRSYNIKCAYDRKTDDEVRKLKLNSALRTLSAFYDSASSENKNYEDSITWLWAVMDPDMTAVICDKENKTLNACELIKMGF